MNNLIFFIDYILWTAPSFKQNSVKWKHSKKIKNNTNQGTLMLLPCNTILWVCWLVSGYNYPPLVLILLTRLHHDYTQVTVKCAAACLLSAYCPPTVLISKYFIYFIKQKNIFSPYTEYEFGVLAVNNVGRGQKSAPVMATTGETSENSDNITWIMMTSSLQ